MNKIKGAFCTMIVLVGSMDIGYANEPENRRNKQSRPSKIKAEPGAKNNLDIISNAVFRGGDSAGKFNIAGEGLIIEPLRGKVSLSVVNAEGGTGPIGGNGLASYNQTNKHIVIENSILSGGKSVADTKVEVRKPAGGAGAICRTRSCDPALLQDYLNKFNPSEKEHNFNIDVNPQPLVLDIKQSKLTGGDLSNVLNTDIGNNSSGGHGIKINGTAVVWIDDSTISSGGKDKYVNGIDIDNGSINIVKSSINAQEGAGINVKRGPSLVIVDQKSNVIGKETGSVGIKANNQCDVNISGKVKGKSYSVLFTGDDNHLTLEPGYELTGKIAAMGNNNHLTLKNYPDDNNSFYLNKLDATNNKQGFNELHKIGDGNWTLHNKNLAGNGMQMVSVTKGSLTLDKSALLWADNVRVDAGASFGGSGIIKGSVHNAGTLYFSKSKQSSPHFKTLTIDGDYHGDGQSTLMFNTKLEGDGSQTDKLVIQGKATGQSQVLVTNRGGIGAKTDKGIPIIQIMSDTLAPTGTFRLAQRVVAGTYDYFLKQENNTWLLTTDVPNEFFENLISASISPTQPAVSPSPEAMDTAVDVPPKKPPRTFKSHQPEVKPRTMAIAESSLSELRVESPVVQSMVRLTPIAETESILSPNQPESIATQTPTAKEIGTNPITELLVEDPLSVMSVANKQEPPAEADPDRHGARPVARLSASVERDAAAVATESDAFDADANPPGAEPMEKEARALDDRFPDDENLSVDETVSDDETVHADEPPLPSSATAVPPLTPAQKAYRPEPGSYLANLAVANMLFTTGMYDRIGDPAYPGGLDTQDNSARPALWLRTVGGRGKSSLAGGQIMTRTYRHLVQLGGEVLSGSSNGQDGLHLGLMAGQGQSHHLSRAALTGYSAKGGLNGYAVGVYASWLQDDAGRGGMYLDGSLNYNWFDNWVKGDSLTEEHYGSRGLVATLETGYQWQWYQTTGFSLHFQPQMQLTWMGVRATHTEANGDRVVSLGGGNLQSRIGGRLYLEMNSVGGSGQHLRFKPYIESHWIHHSRPFGVEIGGTRLYQDGGRDIAELKIGHEGQLNRHVSLWGNLGQRIGGEGFRDTVGTLGIKAHF